MISKNIIKNQYTHRVIESEQKDYIEIGSKEINLPNIDSLETSRIKSNLSEVRIPSDYFGHLNMHSLFSSNAVIAILSIIFAGIIVYYFSELIMNSKHNGGGFISAESFFSVGIFFVLITFSIPLFLIKKKFILKIRNSHLDINYSLNRVQRISLDEVNLCRVINKNNKSKKWAEVDLSYRRKSYRTNPNSSIAVFLKDGRCLLFGIEE